MSDSSKNDAAAIALADQVGKAMFSVDVASKDTMGMQLVSCQPGRAVMRMTIKELHLNGHKICHGGFIFTLADSTFAFACNSYNMNTVGAGCTIDYLAPGREGDVLTAHAVEQALAGKSGVYDVKVSNQEGRAIALFRGKSIRVAGEVISG